MSASIVQQGSTHINGSATLTFSFATPLTAGNAVVACISFVSGAEGAAVNGVNLSDGTELTQRVTLAEDFGTVDGYIYDTFNVAGGETYIEVGSSASGSSQQINMQVYEVSGLSGTVDTSSITSNDSTSYASGPVSTSNATDVWIGMATAFNNSAFTLSAPGGAWTSQSVINNSASSFFSRTISGYQITTSAGSMNYAGTIGSGSVWIAAAVAYESTVTIVSGSGSSTLSLSSSGAGDIRGFATGSSVLALRSMCTPIVVQKLIVSVASEAGVRPSGAAYPAGFALFGVGGLFGYAGVLEASGLSLSLAMNAGTDSAGNAYPAGLMAVGVSLTPITSTPATPPANCVLYYKGGHLYALGPSGTPLDLGAT